jgi:hypothetical protein
MLHCMLGGQSLLLWQWVAPASAEPENAQARPTATIIDTIAFIGVLPFCDLPPKNVLAFLLFVGAPRRLDATSWVARIRPIDGEAGRH